ncbi:hypothetical protein [Geothermobacter hydrogeniphilus]|nr:hypothetical protein [Geothermobacter hydrogeniphilus]
MSENYVNDLAKTDPELNQLIREQIQNQIDNGVLKGRGKAKGTPM